MEMAQLTESQIKQSIFTGVKFIYSDLCHANVQNSDFSNATMTSAKMQGFYDENTLWQGANRGDAQKDDPAKQKAEQWNK
jgi:uncharacterized protein YjbI with pentapeptide repeats